MGNDRPHNGERGFALVTVMLLAVLLMALLAGYFALTNIELSTTRSSMRSLQGFYAAEALLKQEDTEELCDMIAAGDYLKTWRWIEEKLLSL